MYPTSIEWFVLYCSLFWISPYRLLISALFCPVYAGGNTKRILNSKPRVTMEPVIKRKLVRKLETGTGIRTREPFNTRP